MIDKSFIAWTDYPIAHNDGVKPVTVIKYDRDKYAQVKYHGVLVSIKTGYLYQDRELTKSLNKRKLYALPSDDTCKSYSNRDVTHVLKSERKRLTNYTAYVGRTKKIKATNLAAMIKKLTPLIDKETFYLVKQVNAKNRYLSTVIIETYDDKSVGIFTKGNDGRHVLKMHHLKALKLYTNLTYIK